MSVPNGLVKCSFCGDYKGIVRAGDLNQNRPPSDPEAMIEVSCRCDWIVCPRCGIGKMKKPISNDYVEAENAVWHSSYLTAWMGCEKCREKERQRVPRPESSEPWEIYEPRKRVIRGVTITNLNLEPRGRVFIMSLGEDEMTCTECVLLTTTETGQIRNGMIYFRNGRVIAQPETPEDQHIIEDVLKAVHSVEGRRIALADDPEAWFRTLPAIYNGTSFRAMMVIFEEETT